MLNRKRNPYAKLLLIYAIVLATSVYYFFPVVWMFLSSFKTIPEVHNPHLIFGASLRAYQSLFSSKEFAKYALNSLVIGTSTVLGSLVLGIPAGYSLARFRTRISETTTTWVILTRMVPPFGIIIPFYIMITQLKLFDTLVGVVIMHLTFNLPFVIWFLSTYFSEVPVELEESAMIDGCGRIQALLRVTVPVSVPAIIAVSILCFLFSWNEFLFAFMLTSKDARTIPVIIATITGVAFQIDYPAMCAASTFCMLPAFVFISYVQKYVVRGLTMGAVK